MDKGVDVKVEVARTKADKAYNENRAVFVSEISGSIFGDRDEEYSDLIQAIEREGWRLNLVFIDTINNTPHGVFRRDDSRRSLR